MTRPLATGSRVFVGYANAYGTIAGPSARYCGSWLVDMQDGDKLVVPPEMLIDCTALAAVCLHQLAPGGEA